jgi:hypothetical protein
VRVRLLAIAVSVGACSYNEPTTGHGAPDAAVTHPEAGTPSDGAATDAPCVDKDGDGVCDSVDTWLCGAAMPSSPGNTVGLESQNSNLHGVDFGGSNPRVFMATPNQALRFSFDWGLQVDCPGSGSCRAQIEYGIAGVGKVGCAVDINVNDNQFNFGFGSHANLNAPATPAVYEVRAKVGLQSSCGSDWYNSTEPDSSETIAIVCVPP